jgi:hypothetical protein
MNLLFRCLLALMITTFAHGVVRHERRLDVTIEAAALDDSNRMEWMPVVHDGVVVGLELVRCGLGSWCARVGLQRGNVITHINGERYAAWQGHLSAGGGFVLRVHGVDGPVNIHVHLS